MIASVDEYVETLPKMRRAFLAAALLIAGGFGGGTFISQFRLDARLDGVELRASENSSYIAQDRINSATILDRIDDLTCEMNDVPLTVCNYWINNGRPISLQRPE